MFLEFMAIYLKPPQLKVESWKLEPLQAGTKETSGATGTNSSRHQGDIGKEEWQQFLKDG